MKTTMNQTEIDTLLLCLSRITSAGNDHDHPLYQHLNHHISNSVSSHAGGVVERHEDHEHDDDDDNHNHDVVLAKATAMVVLFCATTICGAIPFVLNRFFKWTDNNTNARSATVVKCLLYFGGGVLLCTTFLHLLPEVKETVESLQECETIPELTFPLAELLMCVGFFCMFLVEELIHTYIHSHQETLDDGTVAFERGHSIRHSYVMRSNERTISEDDMQLKDNQNNANTIKRLSVRDLLSNDVESEKHQHNEHEINQQALEEPHSAPRSSSIGSHSHYHSHIHEHELGHGHSHNHSHAHAHSHIHHSHEQHHSHLPLSKNEDDIIASSLRGLLIVLALSLHELFEGLAIGLEGSASNVWFMFAAVSAHKLVLAFCVGVELIVARTRTHLSIIYVFTFAVVSPIGIGIGMLISKQDTTASSIPSAILQGLACGTLLYVVFFEIFSKDRSGLLAYLALIVGFCVMFGLQQLASGHQHSHGCGDHAHAHSHAHSHNLENVKSHDGHFHNESM